MAIPALTNAMQSFRASYGTSVTASDGSVIPCTTASAESDDLDFIPDGDRNAAEADNRVFAFTPSVGQSKVIEGGVLTWNGVAYTVIRAYLTGGGSTWRCVAYRSPQVGASTGDAAQDSVWNTH